MASAFITFALWVGQEGALEPPDAPRICPLTHTLAGKTGTTHILLLPKIMYWALPMGQALFEVLSTSTAHHSTG